MEIEIFSWNVNVFTSSDESIEKKLNFLKKMTSIAPIVCLQECDEKFYQFLLKEKLFDWCVFSLQLRKKGKYDTKNRLLGCIVAGNLPCIPTNTSLIYETPLPERNLVVDIKNAEKEFTVCSLHSLTGASYKRTKVVNFLTIADWLENRKKPMVFGIDANTPESDNPDLRKSNWWWKEEPILFGANASHDMKDSYRIYIEAHPVIFKNIIKENPEGPLAISYKRGPQKIPCRYDFIYVSPEWETKHVQYFYEESLEHGSDHSIVIAKLLL